MKTRSFWRSKDHENVAKLRGLMYESVMLLNAARGHMPTDKAAVAMYEHIVECQDLLDATKE